MDMTDLMVMDQFGFKLALVLHIIGALVLFGALALQVFNVFWLRQAKSVSQVQTAAIIGRRMPMIFGPSSALILLSGLYLSYLDLSNHEAIGWIIVALILFLMLGVSGSVTGERTGKMLREGLSKSKGMMSSELKQLARNQWLLAQVFLSIFGVFGILVVMIFQPGVIISIIVLLVAIAAGASTSSFLLGDQVKKSN